MRMPTVFATAPLPTPVAAARSRSTVIRYSGRSCSIVASMSTMPGILYIASLSRAAYCLSVAMSSPWTPIDSGFWNELGSSRKLSTTPGIFSSRWRATCVNCFTLSARSFLGISFTNTVASRTVSESPGADRRRRCTRTSLNPPSPFSTCVERGRASRRSTPRARS